MEKRNVATNMRVHEDDGMDSAIKSASSAINAAIDSVKTASASMKPVSSMTKKAMEEDEKSDSE